MSFHEGEAQHVDTFFVKGKKMPNPVLFSLSRAAEERGLDVSAQRLECTMNQWSGSAGGAQKELIRLQRLYPEYNGVLSGLGAWVGITVLGTIEKAGRLKNGCINGYDWEAYATPSGLRVNIRSEGVSLSLPMESSMDSQESEGPSFEPIPGVLIAWIAAMDAAGLPLRRKGGAVFLPWKPRKIDYRRTSISVLQRLQADS